MRQNKLAGKSVEMASNRPTATMAALKRSARRLLAVGVLAGIATAGHALPSFAQARNDKIDGEWCRETRSFKVNRENVTTYHGSQVTAEYDGDGLGVRYIAPAAEPEAGSEITVVLRTPEMAYLLRRPKGATGYGERERWQRCKITS